MRRLHTFLALGLVACSSGGGTDRPKTSLLLGTPIDAGACETENDCPVGFTCDANGRCQLVDPDRDNDGYPASLDCNDQDAAVNPKETEVCNAIDDDCDGAVDEGVLNACGACGPEPVEVCDLLDNDCDGMVDELCVGGTIAEVEPNDGAVGCQAIALPGTEGDTVVYTGAFDPAGDRDSFCFSVRAGTALVFDLDSVVLGAPTDGVLVLFDGVGLQMPGGYNDFSDGNDPYLEYTFNADDDIRLDVYDFENTNGGPANIYELKITAGTLVTCTDTDQDGVNTCDGDCNDLDPLIFPGQTEVCDLVDNNCDDNIDDMCPSFARIESEPNNTIEECELVAIPEIVAGIIQSFGDDDTYCFFVPGNTGVSFDIDAQDGPLNSQLNSRLRLYALPSTQLAMNDDGVDPDSGYFATDSDSFLEYGFTLPGIYAIRVEDESSFAGGVFHPYTLELRYTTQVTCTDGDMDGVTTCEGDCNDSDPEVRFGAPEICDGKDNNCDNVGDPGSCTGDFDGDGVSGSAGDCDDGDPTINPSAMEQCDGYDNNCDGQIDEGVVNACGSCGFPPPELCGNMIDDDCDGTTDTDCSTNVDMDGFTPDQGDCDDTDPAINPAAMEVCDGVDNDCDGIVDEFVKNVCGACGADPVEICDGVDNNCNGLIDDGALNACGQCGPVPMEVCDTLDNDCDGDVDEMLLNLCGECGPEPPDVCDWLDNDCDGTPDQACDLDADGDGLTPRQGDCDDDTADDPMGCPGTNAGCDATTGGCAVCSFSGATEQCDGQDNDCNGVIDDNPGLCGDVVELEPNNDQATCTTIQWPGVVKGVIADLSDSDYFCLDIQTPDVTVGFDIDARDNGSPLDPQMRLLDSSGMQLAYNNNAVLDPDTMMFTLDSYISYTFADPGTYVVRVYAAAITGMGTADYELHIRPEGGCTDFDRDGITPCDNDCDDLDAAIGPGVVDICDGIDNNCSGAADERCVGGCLDDLFEPSDTIADATALTPGFSSGYTLCAGDPDVFSITLTTPPQDIQSFAITWAGAGVPVLMELRSPGCFPGMPLATNPDPMTPSLQALGLAAGTYCVVVQATAAGSDDYDVTLVVP